MKAYVAMGCFWGGEHVFADLDGVMATRVGYMGGTAPNPSYEDVCTGATGHAETVEIIYDPTMIAYTKLLEIFWSNHNSTTLNRQGNDIGTQYRSALFPIDDEQHNQAHQMLEAMAGEIEKLYGAKPVTVISDPQDDHIFYPAEEYHQHYLNKNPGGYCNLGFNGLSCPVNFMTDKSGSSQE